MPTSFKHDFAISYAGEDINVAQKICTALHEFSQDFLVFFAPKEKVQLTGKDGEKIFEKLFYEAKQVIVLISESYKKKLWARFEWDIILDRNPENRFIPIRLDNSKIYGLPSNFIYYSYNEENLSELINLCVGKLLQFEMDHGIKRATDFEKNLQAIKNDSKGALAKAFQLVKDNRTRTLLKDLELPKENFTPFHEVENTEWSNFSVIKRLSIYIDIPQSLSEDELKFNLKHCAISNFNKYKPDAMMIFSSCKDSPE